MSDLAAARVQVSALNSSPLPLQHWVVSWRWRARPAVRVGEHVFEEELARLVGRPHERARGAVREAHVEGGQAVLLEGLGRHVPGKNSGTIDSIDVSVREREREK